MRNFFAYAFVSRLLGFVLLLAGVLKGYDAIGLLLASQFKVESSQWVQPSLAVLEMLFGVWLIIGLYPHISWWLSSLYFVMHLGIAFDRAMAGEATCGCFGRFSPRPWNTFALDVVVLVVLALVHSSSQSISWWRNNRAGWLAFLILGLTSVSGLMAATWYGQSHLTDDGDIVGTGAEVYLRLDQWVGQRFPLFKHIDVGPQFQRGRWVLMFFRAGCSDCQTMLPQYMGMAYQLASQGHAVRAALIEVPRPEEQETAAQGSSDICVRGRMSPTRNWRFRTPLFAVLDEGIVKRTFDSVGVVLQDILPSDDKGSEASRAFPDYRKVRRDMFLKEIACGPLALLALLQEFGIRLSKGEADHLLAEAGDKGIDLLRLSELAEEHGLHTLGVAVSAAKLRQIGQKAIVHLNGVGFAAVTGYTSEGLIVVYPLQPAGVVPDDVFTKSFGDEGCALLVSQNPLSAAQLGLGSVDSVAAQQRQGLRLSRGMLSIGRIHRHDWTASVDITNTGGEPIHIERVDISCPECEAEVDSLLIAPGETTTLHVRGTWPRLGGFTHTVVLKSNQPGQETLAIPVRGYVEQPVAFDQPAVMLEDVLAGESAEIKVPIDVPPSLKAEQIKVEIPKAAPLRAEIRQEPGGGAVLYIWFTGSEASGLHRYSMKLTADQSSDAVPVYFHLAVQVRPDVKIFPDSALVREEDWSGTWKRVFELDLHPSVRTPPTAAWCDPALEKVARVTCHGLDERRWVVRIEPLDGGGVHYSGRTFVEIKYGEGKSRKIPIFFGESSLALADGALR
jgi:hypothetical protein